MSMLRIYYLSVLIFVFICISNISCSRYNIHITIKDSDIQQENNEPVQAVAELEPTENVISSNSLSEESPKMDFLSRLKLKRMEQKQIPITHNIAISHKIGSHGPVSSNSPWFCRDKDCPPYQSLNDSNLFETRIYDSNLSFVVYKESGRSLEMAQLRGTNKIYKYINGENDQGIKLRMTTPVITTVGLGLTKNNYTVSYFLPFAFQDSTPIPNDKSLFVYRAPYQLKLAVRGFSGYATTDTALDQLGILQKLLDEAGVKYSYHYWLLAVYDRPQRLSNRHNEVALILLE